MSLWNINANHNTALGYRAGYSFLVLTGSGNIFIGSRTSYNNASLNNAVGIGTDVVLSQSNTIVLGNPTGNINVGIGTATPSKKLEVSGGDASINSLTIGRGSGSIINNTALGVSALTSITTGQWNSAVGYRSWSAPVLGTQTLLMGI